MSSSGICLILLVTVWFSQTVDVKGSSDSDNEVCLIKGGLCSHSSGDAETLSSSCASKESDQKIYVFTIASEATDGYQRFNRSAQINGIQVETLGWGAEWQGGSTLYSGKGYKLNLLKRALKRFDSKTENPIILYTDGYDVIYTQSLDAIVHKFRQTGAGILVSAERTLRTDQTVQHLYPDSESAGDYKYLNAGMFIGYLSPITELLSGSIRNGDSDQLIFERAYLDASVRAKLMIQLDHRAGIFQNLHGSIADLKLDEEMGERKLLNVVHETAPSIIHGNGQSKMFLNNYGNYIAGAFVNDECMECKERIVELKDDRELPTITFAVFILQATPFFKRFLQLIESLDYPKDKLDIFLYDANGIYKDDLAECFVESKGYRSIQWIDAQNIDEAMSRNMAVTYAQQKQTEYLFVIDADAHLDNAQTLRELLKQNRTFIAPMLRRDEGNWSNFWGALSEDGFYARSHDYMGIVAESIRGIWNVPYVTSCYLAKATILPLMNYYDVNVEPDMALCQQLRNKGIFMYVSNQIKFGHLINPDGYNPLLTRPDLYTLLSNPLDWERQYIHADYAAQLATNFTHLQPCPDVFWFPIVTEKFAADLIEIMEVFDGWSDGGSMDTRLEGGYEAVPTRDVHMSQVGLEDVWLRFLKVYVQPLVETVYRGYTSNPPKARMNFVVRYKPTEQAFLKPHHDTSTYTINIALNRAGIDYEGGGCRFIRYDCAVKDTKVGHMLMHPGRLTHFHEGLYVTNGTRYIMVSFIDPVQ